MKVWLCVRLNKESVDAGGTAVIQLVHLDTHVFLYTGLSALRLV